MHCVICSRKVSTAGNEEDEGRGGVNIPPCAPKSVVKAPGFLTTFNEIWRILQNRRKNDPGTDTEITLTTLTNLSRTTEVSFTEPPTICQRCCDKVVSVENLIKAVKHQVREITILFEHSERTKERVGGQSEDNELDNSIEMQIKQDDWSLWHWQDPGFSATGQNLHSSSPVTFLHSAPKSNDSSQVLTSFISEASDNETPMECEDDHGDNDTDKESDDPDYIKSEEENDDDDDNDDSEEMNSSSEEEQEELEIPVNNSAASDLQSTPPPDPLANYSTSKFSSRPSSSSASAPGQFHCNIGPCTESFTNSIHLSRHRRLHHPGEKPAKNTEKPFICDVEGCGREIQTEKGLFFHKQKLHPNEISRVMYPCDVSGCTKMFTNFKYIARHKRDCHPEPPEKEVTTVKSASSKFICDLEGCSRILYNEIGLFNHKRRCHPNIMTAELLEKNKQENSPNFPCSCGQVFHTTKARYRHIIKNKGQHPEYKRDPRKNGSGQKCDICHEVVLFTEIFHHLSEHLNGKNEYIVKCPNDECKNLFTNSKGLGGHISDSQKICGRIGLEKKIGLECETCGFSTTERLSLRNHVESHEIVGAGAAVKEKIWGCPISGCGKMFGVKQSVYYHLSTHRLETKAGKFATQICDKCGGKINVGEMGGHLKDKHGILEKDLIGCKLCEFKFAEREDLVEHLYVHRNVGIICDVCDSPVKYFRYVHFREHYWSVHQICPKKYKCDEEGCRGSTGFWRKFTKDEHYKNQHSTWKDGKRKWETKRLRVKKNELSCEICLGLGVENPGKFLYPRNLISHRIKVHGEEPFNCEVCGEKFDEIGKFNRHQKEMHKGIKFQKEWRCEVEGCPLGAAGGKVFSKERYLKRHMEINHEEGGRKFVCDVCGKGFGYEQGLVKHKESVHLKLRPCICEECGESFTNGNTLKRHKRIHTGERPFGCEICGQRFRHKEVLRRHVIGHEEKGKDFKPNGPMKQLRKRKVQ